MPIAQERRSAADEADLVRVDWYIAPKPPAPMGWLVFSEDFVLRVIQGKYGRPEAVLRTAGWRTIAIALRTLMGVGQALMMLLAYIPIIDLLVEFVAVNFSRGSAGFFLRACFWKAKLAGLGQDTLIDRGVNIWGPGAVRIGAGCHIDKDVRLAAGEAGQGQHGYIHIGDYTHIGPRCNIAGRGGVDIGDFVSMQALVHVYSATNAIAHPEFAGQLISLAHVAPPELQHIVEAPVVVGDYASIGFASLLLPGAWIGLGAIVHPYSQVATRFEAFANIAGPGRARQNGWRRPLRQDPRRAEEY